jgi:PleD family two-component response regulator
MLVVPSQSPTTVKHHNSFDTFGLTTPFTAPGPFEHAVSFVDANPGHSCENMKYLIVDDSEINRRILLKLLEAKGLMADAREDGLQAVELVTENLEAYKVCFSWLYYHLLVL